jgi:hypothetical protein
MPAQLRYDVVAPLGPSAAECIPPSAPLVDLNGKTVAELWDYVFKGDQMFPIIRRALLERYPDVTFVPFETFGNTHGSDEERVIKALPERLRQLGCDAVISAVGC